MRRKSLWIIFSLFVLTVLALLGLFVVSRPRQIDLSYDSSPQKVIMYSDLRWYVFIPPPNEPACLGQYFPSLRVWGDGLVFYEDWPTGQAQPSYWSGHLMPDQIHSILVFLVSQGFFSGWTPEIMNQGGQGLHFGVHLKIQDVEYPAQEIQPLFFTQIIEQISPQLHPVDQLTMTDSRITSLIVVFQSCISMENNTPVPLKPTSTPINISSSPYPYPNPYPGIIIQTPAISPTPTIVPQKTERIYQDVGLLWQECNLSFKDWQSGEECLGISLPKTSEAEKGFFGEQNDGIGPITQTIGNDSYESMFISENSGQLDYALLKNSEVITTITGTIEGYDPNQSLINFNGEILWEFANYNHETVIYDGRDFRNEYGLDAVYRPYIIGRKLIFVARQGRKYYVIYDGQKIGPDFDEISIAYCCEPAMYSISRINGQYWFWGNRNGQNYIVMISAIQ